MKGARGPIIQYRRAMGTVCTRKGKFLRVKEGKNGNGKRGGEVVNFILTGT